MALFRVESSTLLPGPNRFLRSLCHPPGGSAPALHGTGSCMICPHCSGQTDLGCLLATDRVYWSATARLGFWRPKYALPGLAQLFSYGGFLRPLQYSGWSCRQCHLVFAGGVSTQCSHAFQQCWIFPLGSLLWVDGAESWTPRSWFSFSLTGRDGRTPQVLVPSRFTLTFQGTRTAARRCEACGQLEIPLPGTQGAA